jgi:hypothetical protein
MPNIIIPNPEQIIERFARHGSEAKLQVFAAGFWRLFMLCLDYTKSPPAGFTRQVELWSPEREPNDIYFNIEENQTVSPHLRRTILVGSLHHHSDGTWSINT